MKVPMSMFVGPKKLPRRYKAKDAPYPVAGNRGLYIASAPRAYPITAPQRKVKDCAAKCGIKAGMSKTDLMTKMKSCVPTCFGHAAA